MATITSDDVEVLAQWEEPARGARVRGMRVKITPPATFSTSPSPELPASAFGLLEIIDYYAATDESLDKIYPVAKTADDITENPISGIVIVENDGGSDFTSITNSTPPLWLTIFGTYA